jgi:Winged helix DNA-binding domain
MGSEPSDTAGRAARTRRAGGEPLGNRALNRALLARQLLTERRAMPVLDAVEHLLGLQAQHPYAPYYCLWSRLDGFAPEELSRLLIDRAVVRIALLRNTVHLVSAADCVALRPMLQPVFDRGLKPGSPWGRGVVGLDIDVLKAAARTILEDTPCTMVQLGRLLQEQLPDWDAVSMAYIAREQLPLVQLPPRAVWGAGGQTVLTTAEHWLGRPLATDPEPDAMFLRYLAAFGPASVRDAQAWSGLTRLRAVADRLRPRLLVFRDEAGRELFDLPDAPRPDPDTPVPVRFLGEYDTVLLAHADRSRITAEEHRRRLFTANGIVRSAVLVDGFVRGLWGIERRPGGASLLITPFASGGPLAEADRAALAEEGARLLDFAAPDAAERRVAFAEPAA